MKSFKRRVAGGAVGILASLLLSGFAAASAMGIGIVNADDVNVRQGPGLGSAVVGSVTRNFIVEVVEQSDGWYKVRYGENKYGWVTGRYLDVMEGIGTAVVGADDVNFREGPGTTFGVIGSFERGISLTVLEKKDNWYKAKTSAGAVGWISGDFVTANVLDSVGSGAASPIGTGIISGDIVNVRKGPGLNETVICKLTQDTKVTALSRSGDWYRIETSGGTIGWVYSDFLTIRNDTVASRGTAPTAVKAAQTDEPSETSDIRSKIVATAKKYLGTKYVYGGNGPSSFDCSGYVKYVMGIYGITLNRVAADQAKQGIYVKKSDLKPADLVFFNTNRSAGIDHVGMYIGNGQFIHASSGSARKVVITDLDSYGGQYVTGRDVLGR